MTKSSIQKNSRTSPFLQGLCTSILKTSCGFRVKPSRAPGPAPQCQWRTQCVDTNRCFCPSKWICQQCHLYQDASWKKSWKIQGSSARIGAGCLRKLHGIQVLWGVEIMWRVLRDGGMRHGLHSTAKLCIPFGREIFLQSNPLGRTLNAFLHRFCFSGKFPWG